MREMLKMKTKLQKTHLTTSELLMEQVRTTRRLATLIEGLPLSPAGMRQKTRAEGMGVPFVLGAVS